MTGPEHYREAERLVRMASAYQVTDDFKPEEETWASPADMLAAAQAHATLALTAATLFSAGVVEMPEEPDWDEALS
jgi:hypothetical protein